MIDIGLYHMVMQIYIATESHRTLSTSFTDTYGWHTAWFELGKIATTYVT